MNSLLISLYNLLALPVLAAAVPLLALRRWREGLGERLGARAWVTPSGAARPIWIHGASVGEVLAAQGLVRRLLEAHPETRLVFSTFTSSGRATVRERLGDCGERMEVTLAPLDWDGIPARVLSRCDPSLFIILETELWPNLILALHRRGCPVVLVNGRLSERSFPRYRALRWFFRPLLASFSMICARSPVDAARFCELGAQEGKVRVTGNIKYDFESAATPPPWFPRWPGAAGEGRRRLVAGSLRGGESGSVLRSFSELAKRFQGLQLLLAPRHPERFDAAVLSGSWFSWCRWSEVRDGGSGGGTDVILVDTLGDLAALYAAADIAFVGGTLEGGEGQNLLEPAAHAVPVLFGPGYGNFREEGDELIREGGGFVTADGEELTAQAGRLLAEPALRREAGRRAKGVADRFGGGTERTLQALRSFVDGEDR